MYIKGLTFTVSNFIHIIVVRTIVFEQLAISFYSKHAAKTTRSTIRILPRFVNRGNLTTQQSSRKSDGKINNL